MGKIGLLFLCALQYSCSGQVQEKIDGISFVASRGVVSQEHINSVMELHADYAALMPFGFIKSLDSPEIIFDSNRQWVGETRRGVKQCMELLHKNGIKVMLKPQIWIWRGEFTGTLKMNSEEDWKTLESSYEKFVVAYAEVAQESKAEILCIGTELGQFVKHRPDYWKRFIKKIRSVYKGKLTYAANWDEYPKVPFWEDLDYIGIDAYFPLSEEKTPTVEQLRLGWVKYKQEMELFSKTKKKPVLFTEYGYRSMDYAAKKPWLVHRNEENPNMEAQANATKAIFEEFWQEDWFVGGFAWKWFIDHKRAGGPNDNRFTPQNKPAEEIIRSYYKKTN